MANILRISAILLLLLAVGRGHDDAKTLLLRARRAVTDTLNRLVIKIRLETVQVGGVFYPLEARFDSGLRRSAKISGVLSQRVEIGNLETEDGDDGAFPFWDPNAKQVIASGLESGWLTLGS